MMSVGVHFLPNRHHTCDVNFVSYIVIEIKGLIIFMAELKHKLLSPPQTLGQSNAKEASGIGPGSPGSHTVGRCDLDVGNWQLPVWNGILP
jgi:hypothetical protein